MIFILVKYDLECFFCMIKFNRTISKTHFHFTKMCVSSFSEFWFFFIYGKVIPSYLDVVCKNPLPSSQSETISDGCGRVMLQFSSSLYWIHFGILAHERYFFTFTSMLNIIEICIIGCFFFDNNCLLINCFFIIFKINIEYCFQLVFFNIFIQR